VVTVGVTVVVGVIEGVGVTVGVVVVVGVGLGLTADCGTFPINPPTHTGPLPDIPNALLIASLDGPLMFGFAGLRGLYIYF
jgi:hypothetical protein